MSNCGKNFAQRVSETCRFEREQQKALVLFWLNDGCVLAERKGRTVHKLKKAGEGATESKSLN